MIYLCFGPDMNIMMCLHLSLLDCNGVIDDKFIYMTFLYDRTIQTSRQSNLSMTDIIIIYDIGECKLKVASQPGQRNFFLLCTPALS